MFLVSSLISSPPQEYIKRKGGFFADISEGPQTVIEAIQMADTWADKMDIYQAEKARLEAVAAAEAAAKAEAEAVEQEEEPDNG